MAGYIERKALYKELLELEALARERVLDTPTTSPAYQRYSAQLTERNAIRHMIAEIPAADVAPVVHGRWAVAQILFKNGYTVRQRRQKDGNKTVIYIEYRREQ